jgi:hypothetical protein
MIKECGSRPPLDNGYNIFLEEIFIRGKPKMRI